MRKIYTVLFVLFVLNLNVSAQAEKSAIPIKWERYKISDREVSISLPKMPVAFLSADPCNELEGKNYSVYAEEVVYQFIVVFKSKQEIPDYCKVRNKFSRETFENRIEQFKRENENFAETNLKIKEKDVTKLAQNSVTYWFFDDLKNNRWFELVITHREDAKPKTDEFVNSIEFGKNPNGIEIRKGSDRTLGDEVKESENKSEETPKSAATDKTEAMVIVSKPRASYTDVARQTQTQGTVTLRVTFLANGGIGSIMTVHGLPNGLTEQAVSAAGKIVFLPQKVKGKTVSVIKQVQYTFTIY